ncbi:hypothetical protein [Conyzicola lurida]|nr:hypothetical protein [Conyzicola lurida]
MKSPSTVVQNGNIRIAQYRSSINGIEVIFETRRPDSKVMFADRIERAEGQATLPFRAVTTSQSIGRDMTVKPKERGTILVCHCCGVPNEIYMESATSHQVCDPCKRHSTGDWKAVTRTHTEWVVAYYSERERLNAEARQTARAALVSKQAEVEKLTARFQHAVSTMASQYADAPIGDLQNWVRAAVVSKAGSDRDTAFRTRDAAMRVVWRIDQLHRKKYNRDTACSCGTKATSCRELKAVEPFADELDRWEDEQLARLSKGRDCGLPKEHPKMAGRGPLQYSGRR